MDDADVKVMATGQIAVMYIRKQNIFTEKKIYPYAKDEDMRLDLLLGRDDVIFSVNSVYRTDALLRKVNLDRYDDCLIVQTNYKNF